MTPNFHSRSTSRRKVSASSILSSSSTPALGATIVSSQIRSRTAACEAPKPAATADSLTSRLVLPRRAASCSTDTSPRTPDCNTPISLISCSTANAFTAETTAEDLTPPSVGLIISRKTMWTKPSKVTRENGPSAFRSCRSCAEMLSEKCVSILLPDDPSPPGPGRGRLGAGRRGGSPLERHVHSRSWSSNVLNSCRAPRSSARSIPPWESARARQGTGGAAQEQASQEHRVSSSDFGGRRTRTRECAVGVLTL